MSNPLDEYIAKKCDGILLNDKVYCEANRKIVNMEAAFKATLTPEQQKAYNAIEYESLLNATHGMGLIAKEFLSDKTA